MSGGLQGLSLGNGPLYERVQFQLTVIGMPLSLQHKKKNYISTGLISLEGNRPVCPRDSLKY